MGTGRSYNAVEVQGLKEFRDGLRLMGPEYVKELRVELKNAGEVVRRAASENAPVGTRPKTVMIDGVRRTVPHLRDTMRTRVSGDRVSVFSNAPYANVIQWGGNVPGRRSPSHRPKRAFTATRFVTRAVDAHTAELEKGLLDAVDTVARRNGWNDR